MKDTLEKFDKIINETPDKILSIDEKTFSEKVSEEKWSKKEILGHLVDSASNNHHRFVKIQFEDEPFLIKEYEQDNWVAVQKYKDENTKRLLSLWKHYNMHLYHIISIIPTNQLTKKCKIDENRTETLQWLIEDYVNHQQHHLNQILG